MHTRSTKLGLGKVEIEIALDPSPRTIMRLCIISAGTDCAELLISCQMWKGIKSTDHRSSERRDGEHHSALSSLQPLSNSFAFLVFITYKKLNKTLNDLAQTPEI